MARMDERYTLDGEIGRGAGSTVYRAYDRRTHALCALKVLRTTRKPVDVWHRFEREVKLMTDLRHPHILRVFDYDLEADRPWMAMPFVRAGSVRQHLDKRGPLPIGDVLVHGIEILGALATAHAAGVIHRDIKPSNLLKASSGLQVADFGIAALVEDRSDNGAIGSMAFMAPEAQDGEVGVASDLFAVGVTLFVMISDGNPFALANDDRRSSRMRKVPAGLRRVIHRATRPDSADRHGSPAEMADDLRRAAAGTAFLGLVEAATVRSMPLAAGASTGYPDG